jgi:hypothetical protein
MSRPNKRIQKNLNVDNINGKIINWNHELSFRDKKVFPGGQFTLDASLNEVTGFNTHNPGDKKFYMWDHTNTDEGEKAAIFTQYNYVGINTEPDQNMIANRTQPTLDLGVDGQIRIGHPPFIPGAKDEQGNDVDVPYSINNNASDVWQPPDGTIVYSNEAPSGGYLFYHHDNTWFRLLAANDQIPDISTNWAINNQSDTIFIKGDIAGETREGTNRLSLGLKYADISRNTDNLRINSNNGQSIKIRTGIENYNAIKPSDYKIEHISNAIVKHDISCNETDLPNPYHLFTINNEKIACLRFEPGGNKDFPQIGLGTHTPAAFLDVSAADFAPADRINYIKMGTGNTIDANASAIFGKDNDLSGQLLFTFGSNNTNHGKLSSIYGDNNKINTNDIDNGFNYIYGQDNDISNSNFSFITGISNEITNADRTFIFGEENKTTDNVNLIVGSNNTINNGHNNNIFGQFNDISGSLNLVHGKNNKITVGSNHVILGYNNTATDQSSFILGISNETLECESVAIGFKNKTEDNAKHSFAIGNENKIQSMHGITIGLSNEILAQDGQHSIAIGTTNKIDGVNNAIALGQNAELSGDAQKNIRFVIGTAGDGQGNTNPAGNKMIMFVDGKTAIGPYADRLNDISGLQQRLQIDNNEPVIQFLRNVNLASSSLAVTQYGARDGNSDKTFGAIGGIDLSSNGQQGYGGLVFYVNNLDTVNEGRITSQYRYNNDPSELLESMRIDNSGVVLINRTHNPLIDSGKLDAYVGDMNNNIRINSDENHLAVDGNIFIKPLQNFYSFNDVSGAHILLQDANGDSYFQNDNSNCKIVIGTQKNIFTVSNSQFFYNIGNKRPLIISEQAADDFYFNAKFMNFNADSIGFGLHKYNKATDASSQVIIDSIDNKQLDNHLTLTGKSADISYVQMRLDADGQDSVYFGRHVESDIAFIKNKDKNDTALTIDFSNNFIGINMPHEYDDEPDAHLEIHSKDNTGLYILGTEHIVLGHHNVPANMATIKYVDDSSGVMLDRPFTIENKTPDDNIFTLTPDNLGIKINQKDKSITDFSVDHIAFQHRDQELKNKHLRGDECTWQQHNINWETGLDVDEEDKSIWRIADKSGNNIFTGINRFQDTVVLQQKGSYSGEKRDFAKPKVLLDVSGFDMSYNGVNLQPYLIIDASAVQIPRVTVDHINSDISDNGILGQMRYNKQYQLFEGFHEISGNLGGWKSLGGINDMSGTKMEAVIERDADGIIGSHPKSKIMIFVNDVSMGWIDASGLTIYNNDITIKGTGEFYRDYDGQPRKDDTDTSTRKKIDNYWTQVDHYKTPGVRDGVNLEIHDENVLDISDTYYNQTRDYIFREGPVILGRDKPEREHSNGYITNPRTQLPFYTLDVSGGLYCDNLYLGKNHFHFIDYESGANPDSSADITYSMSDFTIGDPEGQAIMSLIGGISGEGISGEALHSYILMGSGKDNDHSGNKLEIKWDGSNCCFDNSVDVSGTIYSDKMLIGTTNNIYASSDISGIPLVVGGDVQFDYIEHSNGVTSSTIGTSGDNFSIYSQGNIFVNGGYVFVKSDKRIKTNIEEVPDEMALKQVRTIPCKYYNYKDTSERGTDKTIGFIAQEVKKVMPMAVKTISGIIPSVMKSIETPIWTKVNNKFQISLEDFDIQPGSKVRFYLGQPGESSITKDIILDFSKNAIFDAEYDSVFIYGEHVIDLNILNKEKIFTLHHSAIQELDKKTRAMEQTVKDCNDFTSETKDNIAKFKNTADTLSSEFKNIKNESKLLSEDFVLLKNNFENRIDTEFQRSIKNCNDFTHIKHNEINDKMDNNHKTTTENIHVNKSTIGKNINHINTLYTLNSKTKDKTEDNIKSISQVSKDLIAHKSLCEEYKQHELARFNKVEENIHNSVKNLQINIDDADEKILQIINKQDSEKKNFETRINLINSPGKILKKDHIKNNILKSNLIASHNSNSYKTQNNWSLNNKHLIMCDNSQIKSEAEIIDKDTVLDTVSNIECKMIKYKDQKNTDKAIVGFEPESIAEMYPEAITKINNFTPDGMTLLQNTAWGKNSNNEWILKINDSVKNNFTTGNKIKLICSNEISIDKTHYISKKETMVITTIINENECQLENRYNYVYYYGCEKESNHVELEKIVALQHVAIQELKNKVENEQARNSYLEDRITKLENLIKQL